MQAIEFEATAHDHFIRIPDTAPDGVPLRVLLLVEEVEAQAPVDTFKALLTNVAESLDDTDLERRADFGRELPEWDI